MSRMQAEVEELPETAFDEVRVPCTMCTKTSRTRRPKLAERGQDPRFARQSPASGDRAKIGARPDPRRGGREHTAAVSGTAASQTACCAGWRSPSKRLELPASDGRCGSRGRSTLQAKARDADWSELEVGAGTSGGAGEIVQGELDALRTTGRGDHSGRGAARGPRTRSSPDLVFANGETRRGNRRRDRPGRVSNEIEQESRGGWSRRNEGHSSSRARRYRQPCR